MTDYPINYNILTEDFREQQNGTRDWSQEDAAWLFTSLCKMCDAYDSECIPSNDRVIAERLLRSAANALERCQVANDPSGAADEAAAILEQVVTLNGEYVPERGGTR